MNERRIPLSGLPASARRRLSPCFSPEAAAANARLAEEYDRRMGISAEFLRRHTRPHCLRTFLRTPIPLSVAGTLSLGLLFLSLRLPFLIALPLSYLFVVALGYGILYLAGEKGMAMGARAVTYRESEWRSADEALSAIGPPLYHGWTHLAGRRGMLRLHNSLAVAAGYLRARELGDEYHIYHFRQLARTVEAGSTLGGWSELERAVAAETRGPIGWLREWTKYQYLGHSRNAYVLGGLIAGRALYLARETGADPWCYLRAIGAGSSMAAAEAELLRRTTPEVER